MKRIACIVLLIILVSAGLDMNLTVDAAPPISPIQSSPIVIKSLPKAPSNLSVTRTSDTVLSLSWEDNANNETGFIIEKIDSKTEDFLEIAKAGSNTTAYKDKVVPSETNYSYRVKAYNQAGCSAYSNEASLILPTTTPTTTPTPIPTPAPVLTSPDTALLTVQQPDINISPGTISPGQISESPVNVSPSQINITVATPTNLTATSPQAGQVVLHWQDKSSNEECFIIERKSGNYEYYPLYTEPANSTTHEEKNELSTYAVFPGETYSYRVKAVCGTISSGYSNEVSIKVSVEVAAPSNLTAVCSQPGKITLNWHDNSSNETNFLLERKFDGTFYPVASRYPNTTIYDYPTDSERTYTFRIKAQCGDSSSGYSNEVSVEVPATQLPIVSQLEISNNPLNSLTEVIAAPSSLTAVSNQPGVVSLHWVDNASNETQYIVERSEWQWVTTQHYITVATFGANVTSFQEYATQPSPNHIEIGKMYYYRVKAANAHTQSNYSNEVYTAVSNVSVPAQPTELKAVIDPTTHFVHLSWKDNSPNDDHFVVEKKQPGQSFTKIKETAASATADEFQPQPNVEYTYRVGAVNSAATCYSETATARLDTSLPFSNPSFFYAESVSSSSIKLHWNDNSNNEDEFVIKRKKHIENEVETNDGYVIALSVGQNVTEAVDNGLEPCTQYDYKLYARNDVGQTQATYNNLDYTKECIMGTTVPLTPGMTASAVNSHTVKLTITNPNTEPMCAYWVYRKAEGQANFIILPATSSLEYYDQIVSPGKTYSYKVKAWPEEDGLIHPGSDFSEVVTVTTPSIDAP